MISLRKDRVGLAQAGTIRLKFQRNDWAQWRTSCAQGLRGDRLIRQPPRPLGSYLNAMDCPVMLWQVAETQPPFAKLDSSADKVSILIGALAFLPKNQSFAALSTSD